MKLSIIIPHKDIPELLRRCLDSIPINNYREVIIVDDNSSPERMKFDKYPGSERPDTIIINTKDGKGAGFARNIGLQNASGEWIMFADADDFFLPDAFNIIEKYFHSDFDLIYFNTEAKISEDLNRKSNRMDFYKSLINNKDINYLRFQANGPMLKLIKREIIYNNEIRFDETHVANDIYFSMMVGIHSNKIAVERQKIMCITERKNSLMTHYHDRRERIIRFLIILKCNQILESIGMSKYSQDSLKWYFGPNIRNMKEWLNLKYLLLFIYRTKFRSIKFLYWAIKACKKTYPSKKKRRTYSLFLYGNNIIAKNVGKIKMRQNHQIQSDNEIQPSFEE